MIHIQIWSGKYILIWGRYKGYDKELVDSFGAMGFQVPDIVRIFAEVGISQRCHQLDEGQVDDICARLLAGV